MPVFPSLRHPLQQSLPGDHHYPDGLPFSLRFCSQPMLTGITLPFISAHFSAPLALCKMKRPPFLLSMLYKSWGQQSVSKSCTSRVNTGLGCTGAAGRAQAKARAGSKFTVQVYRLSQGDLFSFTTRVWFHLSRNWQCL